jgi:hypothetical protein
MRRKNPKLSEGKEGDKKHKSKENEAWNRRLRKGGKGSYKGE